MARLEELKTELAATIEYGKRLGDQLQDPDLSQAERLDQEAELEAVETKAEGLARDLGREQKNIDRELRIKAIGRDQVGVEPPAEVAPVQYKDAFQAFFASEQYAEFASRYRAGERTTSARLEFKAARDVTDETADQVGQVAPGIANLNYTFPLSVGDLFTQGTMQGASMRYLKIPTTTTGDAAYQTGQPTALGGQKGGTFVMTLDVGSEDAQTVAAIATIPSQNLDDVTGLENEVRTTLTVGPNGIGELLEDEYINGTGSGTAINGVLNLTPDNVDTSTFDYLSLAVFKAMADINATSGFTADAVVVHPDDWFLLSTEVGSSDNRPLFGPWGTGWGANGVGPRLVVSRKIDSGTILVGAFKASTRYVRSGLTVFADASGIGLRDKNLVLFVAEARELLLHRFGADPYRTVGAS